MSVLIGEGDICLFTVKKLPKKPNIDINEFHEGGMKISNRLRKHGKETTA